MLKRQVSLTGDRRNDTKCENCIINILRQQLKLIDENTPTFNKEQKILTQLKEVFAQLAVIIVTSEGEVKFMTQRAKELLSKYFSCCAPYSLPESLQHWFKHQIQISLLTSESKPLCSCVPFFTHRANRKTVKPLSHL